jgi:hypothetical protein
VGLFCDMLVELSALSLLILLVGAVVLVLFVSESDVGMDVECMDGLCKVAGVVEEEEEVLLPIVGGC